MNTLKAWTIMFLLSQTKKIIDPNNAHLSENA